MATREEFIKRCKDLPPEELKAIMHHDMGGKDVPLDEFYEHASREPQCDARICRKLGLVPEADCLAKATYAASALREVGVRSGCAFGYAEPARALFKWW